MSAYQKVKELQDEIEQMTGVRPHIQITFYSHYGNYDDEIAAKIRNVLVTDSFGQLATNDMQLGSDEVWTAYQAFDHDNHIQLCSHGPKVTVTTEQQCGV